jgi:Domain of unknown function (DUF4129)
MPRAGTRLRGDARAIAVTAVGLLLLSLVALASGGSPWNAGGGNSDVPSGAASAVAAAGGALVVGSLLLVWVGTPGAEKRRRRRRRLAARDLEELGASLSAAGKAAAVVLGSVGVFLIVCLAFVAPDAEAPRGGAGVTGTTPGHVPAPVASGHARSDSLSWLVLGGAATLLLLTPVAVVLRRRRARRARALAVPDDATHVGSGLRASLAELEGERDPRVAIQRAYERMEESFGAIELVRALDETPSEFTTRVLRAMGAGAAPASDLTGLFEVARFSDHTMTEEDRRRAITSVRRVEAELARR